MGLSSKKTTQTNKPIYDTAISGAAGNISDAYNAAKPGLDAGAAKFGGILDSVISKYQAGDPAITAGRGYATDVLSGKYLSEGNPNLTAIIDSQGNDIANNLSAGLGTRGLTGGSSSQGIIGRALARNASDLRYKDYDAERARMGQTLASLPGLVASENGMLDPAFQAYEAMQGPLRAAVGAGNGIGGLLGQYQTVKTKQSQGLGGILAQLAGNAAQAYAMGG